MSWEKWEVEAAVDRDVMRYYENGGRHYTKEGAVRIIREGLEKYLLKPFASWLPDQKEARTMARLLSYEMMKRIRADEGSDPIRTIIAFMYWMEVTMSNSDSPMVWDFSDKMLDAASEIYNLFLPVSRKVRREP